MNFQKTSISRLFVLSFITVASVFAAFAQSSQEPPVTQVTVVERPKMAQDIAGRTNLYCAGYIQTGSIGTANRLIGGQDEADKFTYSQNDFLYINMGLDKGVNIGDTFAVVRPRGPVKSKWSKKGDLGFYVQEVGAVEVINVKREVSVVRVKTSCDTLLLGDLIQLVPTRISPLVEPRDQLNRFGDPSGKASGRIVLSRDGHEMLTRDQIAFVDLGAEDNIRVGDRLTVFRPLEKGNITHKPDRESVSSRDYGFESDKYAGGKFSNQSARKSGENGNGQEVRTRDIRNARPDYLRKVVGEAVVLNVKEKTATIVITRTGQEIHTGDWVEIQ